jgi:two-component system chemotaxis response regulator CheB
MTRLQIGVGYVCPGGNCVELVRDNAALMVRVVPPEPTDRFIPSVDRLFESAALAAGQRVIAVVLTGMGDDGARGVVAVKDSGGTVFAEAPDTAVIYGMPGSAARTGKVDRSLPLKALAEHVAEITS